MQFNSTTRPFANRKTVKQSRYTCSTVLEVQNCKSTIQSALVFFLANTSKNSTQSFTHIHTYTHSQKTHHCFKTISVSVTVWIGVRKKNSNRDTRVRLAHRVLQSTNFISHWWKVASGKMEITVRVVSCLLGTCFVIDYVPVKSEILINERKKMKKILTQETVSCLFVWFFYSYNDVNILLCNPYASSGCYQKFQWVDAVCSNDIWIWMDSLMHL